MQSTKLAEFFNRQREIVEAAELPFAKLAIFILPIIAPLVPAVMTGLHMFNLFSEIFTFAFAIYIIVLLAAVVGLVLELLGYVGAISFIRAIFDLVRKGKEDYLIPAVLTFLAYAFYLVAMFMINVKLGEYFNIPVIMNNIIGILSFITVPTGLLSATHLSSKENKEEDRELRQEKNDLSLKKTALKQGINIFAPQPTIAYPQEVAQVKHGDWRTLSPQEQWDVVNVLTIPQIMEKHKVGRSTAFEWKKKQV